MGCTFSPGAHTGSKPPARGKPRGYIPMVTLHSAICLLNFTVLHSHSIVAGGLLLMSYTTRFTPFTSLMIRVDMRRQQIVRQAAPVGRHEIFGLDRAHGQ